MGKGEEALRFLACIRKETMHPTPLFNLFRTIGNMCLTCATVFCGAADWEKKAVFGD
jgi:hypothetical protein